MHSTELLVSHPRRLPLERGLSEAQRAATRASWEPCEAPGLHVCSSGPPSSCTPCLPTNSPYGLSVCSMDRAPPLQLRGPAARAWHSPGSVCSEEPLLGLLPTAQDQDKWPIQVSVSLPSIHLACH